jgi:2-oxoglutarate ferredoxin oxidoreductase subunit gamma
MAEKIDRFEVRLAGAGGQGLILAGLILADAVAIYDDRNAVQTQSYGPEARGGASKSEVVISDGEINFPKVMSADVLLALSQEACDKYFYGLKPEGLLVVDSDLVERVPSSRAVEVPITGIAQEATGRAITANSVGLGLVGGLTTIVSRQALERAVEARVPKGTAEMNLKALAAGWEKALEIKKEREFSARGWRQGL